MAIRIRKINDISVALCAAKSSHEPGDIYMDDVVHHALYAKFSRDMNSEGWIGHIPENDLHNRLALTVEKDIADDR